MLDHHRQDRQDLDHRMAQWFLILSLLQRAAAAAGLLVVFHQLSTRSIGAAPDRIQMAQLAAPLAATAFEPFERLKPWAVVEGKFGGVARIAADPLSQRCQLGRQGGELAARQLDLLHTGPKRRLGRQLETLASPPLKSQLEDSPTHAVSA